MVQSNEGTVAWIGSELSQVDRPVWQIKLARGARVAISDEVRLTTPDGHSAIWYQILPPVGELRWVHISKLQLPTDPSEYPKATNGGKMTTAAFNQQTTLAADRAILQTDSAVTGIRSSNDPMYPDYESRSVPSAGVPQQALLGDNAPRESSASSVTDKAGTTNLLLLSQSQRGQQHRDSIGTDFYRSSADFSQPGNQQERTTPGT
jgi:hypothetical protein